jgi:F-type H+-transporting ATPase subunit b
MRLRHKIAAGALLAVPMLLLPMTAAHAADEPATTEAHAEEVTLEINGTPIALHEIGECKEADKILEVLQAPTAEEQTKKVEDCFSAESPIIPKLSEVFWGGIAWLLVMIVVVKAGVPAMKKTMTARSEKIKGDLDAAEAAKTSANAELADYRAKLADAQSEANRIIDEARQSADGVRKDLIARAEADAAEVRARANEEVRLASERAMADLSQQVATMSVDLAGKIVEKNLDVATQQQLIDSYINNVGSN